MCINSWQFCSLSRCNRVSRIASTPGNCREKPVRAEETSLIKGTKRYKWLVMIVVQFRTIWRRFLYGEDLSSFENSFSRHQLDSITSNYHNTNTPTHLPTHLPTNLTQSSNLDKVAFPKCDRDPETSSRYEKIERKKEKARDQESEYSREWYNFHLNPDRVLRGTTKHKSARKGK